MKTARNKQVKLLTAILVLLVGVVLSLTFLSGYGKSAFAMEGAQLMSVEKVYSRTTIDDDFDGNTANL